MRRLMSKLRSGLSHGFRVVATEWFRQHRFETAAHAAQGNPLTRIDDVVVASTGVCTPSGTVLPVLALLVSMEPLEQNQCLRRNQTDMYVYAAVEHSWFRLEGDWTPCHTE